MLMNYLLLTSTSASPLSRLGAALTGARSTCPAHEPSNQAYCLFDVAEGTTCTYGKECCDWHHSGGCQCHDSRRYECMPGGLWSMMYTDACFGGTNHGCAPGHPTQCTSDGKVCSDGSVVGRDPNNNCEWHPCPIVVTPGCTADAKMCPDGSFVGRDDNNNCDWFPCPIVVGPATCPANQADLPADCGPNSGWQEGDQCFFGEECCCGTCHASRESTCRGGVWETRFTHACQMPNCNAPPAVCPVAEPLNFGSCAGFSDGHECFYGQETCCGVTHPSREYTCFSGTWSMMHTDACFNPICPGCPSGGAVNDPVGTVKHDPQLNRQSVCQFDGSWKHEETCPVGQTIHSRDLCWTTCDDHFWPTGFSLCNTLCECVGSSNSWNNIWTQIFG